MSVGDHKQHCKTYKSIITKPKIKAGFVVTHLNKIQNDKLLT